MRVKSTRHSQFHKDICCFSIIPRCTLLSRDMLKDVSYSYLKSLNASFLCVIAMPSVSNKPPEWPSKISGHSLNDWNESNTIIEFIIKRNYFKSKPSKHDGSDKSMPVTPTTRNRLAARCQVSMWCAHLFAQRQWLAKAICNVLTVTGRRTIVTILATRPRSTVNAVLSRLGH